jgi:hypothetical protein
MMWRALSIRPYVEDAAYANIVKKLESAIGKERHGQGLTLVPISAQQALICSPYNPT